MRSLVPKITLSRRVAQVLRREILRRYRPGQRLASEADLAKRFGVSIVTLREAILKLSHEGLVERRHGSGTYVKDGSERQHVAVLAETDISYLQRSHFYLRLFQELLGFFRNRGLRVRLYMGHHKPGEEPRTLTCTEFLDSVARQELCGVVAVGTHRHPRWVRPLRKQGVPIVGDAHTYRYGVGHDRLELVRQGTRRLLEQGRRKIAWMDFPFAMGERATDELLQAFRETMNQYGATVNPGWIRRDIQPSLPGAGWEEFREIWLDSDEKPDGLLICDDVLSRDAAMAIAELGIRVPEQLRVVTAANKGSQIFYPFPVERLEYDPDAFGRAMGEMLLNLMQKKPVEQSKVCLTFQWVEAEAMARLVAEKCAPRRPKTVEKQSAELLVGESCGATRKQGNK